MLKHPGFAAVLTFAALLGCGGGEETSDNRGVTGGSSGSGVGGGATGGQAGGGGSAQGGSTPAGGGGVDSYDGGLVLDALATSAGQCEPDAGLPFSPPSMVSPEVRTALTGINGSFQDTCDANGNLTEYTCERKQTCGAGPNPACTYWLTGQVLPQTIDCNGRCKDGRCSSRCPMKGDVLVYKAVEASGAATFTNQTDGRVYSCAGLGFDKPNDGYDCKVAVAGQQMIVIGIGMTGSYCTGGQFGNIAAGTTATEEKCAYVECRFAD